MQPKILVIGSKDHDRAVCVDWLQPFPNIEEYDSIIVNMHSLTQEIYDKVQRKIYELRNSIDTVFNTEREIFCILDKVMSPSLPPKRPGEPVFASVAPVAPGDVPSTNYDWLPIRILVDSQKTGSSINLRDLRFAKYFETIDNWKFEIGILRLTIGEILRTWAYSIYPIAVNKSQKTIAGSVKQIGLNGKVLIGHEKGAIHLLPPPTKVASSQAIELILDLIIGEETRIVQPWREDIEVPKEKELEKEIEKRARDIQRIQEEISQIRDQIYRWDSYRDLLTSTGDELENIVQRTLKDIEIETKKTEKGFPADLISEEIAVEITGIKGCVGVGSDKVNQTGRFKESYHKKEKIVLVANTYMDLSPHDRKQKIDFSSEVKKYFESLSVCCLTSMTLFQLWKDVIDKRINSKSVRSKIFKKDGELTLKDFK